MAYFNNTNDANPDFTSSVYEEFDPYLFLGQTSAGEWAENRAFDTSIHDLGMVEQPGPMVGSSSSRATTSYEPVASANPYTNEFNSDGQLTYPGYSWQTVGHQAQSHNSGFQSQDDFFQSTMASEPSAVVPTSSSGLLNYWGTNQSGPSAGIFYTQNVQPSYLPSTGPTRPGLIPTMRFQPYETSRAHVNEHRNAEAGSSTLAPPFVPYVGLPTPQPSGGISEMPADAGINNTTIEEDKVPTTKGTRCPRGEGRPRPHRVRTQGVADKLRAWGQQQEGLSAPPTLNDALEVAVEIIRGIRPLVSQQPRLRTMQGKPAATSSRHAKAELERRDEERGFLKELSRYFPLDQGQNKWTRSSLLSRVLKELEDHSAPPGPSNEPDP